MENTFIYSLKETINQQWEGIRQGKFWNLVLNQTVSKKLYYDLMLEIHHYTKHNSRNQAAAAFVEAPDGLLRFAYHHAADELGHERMAANDMESIGILQKDDLKRTPLPATEALIGYLYFVAFKYGPLPRLGYSFWAENVYDQIGEILAKIRKDLSLADKNMTFFVAHAKIDEKHIDQVTECIERYATTPEQQALVQQVASTTLFLTGQMLEQIAQRHL